MTQHCMRSYTQLVIKTCHRRGVHAMGGMAAQIPIKNNPAANQVMHFLHMCMHVHLQACIHIGMHQHATTCSSACAVRHNN